MLPSERSEIKSVITRLQAELDDDAQDEDHEQHREQRGATLIELTTDLGMIAVTLHRGAFRELRRRFS